MVRGDIFHSKRGRGKNAHGFGNNYNFTGGRLANWQQEELLKTGGT